MLELRNVSKSFGRKSILSDISLELPEGDIGGILGPSGAGKSTLFSVIAGLERASSGRIAWKGEPWDGPDRFVPPERRPVGLVFQDFALFPHLTVAQNVAFGLRLRRHAGAAVSARVAQLLERMRLDGLAGRYPHQLSGGQKQRVAVARALAVEPEILLFDESLSSLDAKLRDELRVELRDLLLTLRLTAIFVTHDPVEAMLLASRIFVLRDGSVLASGSPQELYQTPPSPEVAETLGPACFLPTVVHGTDGDVTSLEVGGLPLHLRIVQPPTPGRYRMLLRASSCRIASTMGNAVLPAEVVRSIYVGGAYQVAVRLPTGATMEVRHHAPPPSKVALEVLPGSIHFLP